MESASTPDSAAQNRLPIAVAMHELNHQPRPCLGGRIACAVEFDADRPLFTPSERQTIFSSIFNNFRENISRHEMEHPDHPCRTTQWRRAVESWLRCQQLIRVTINNNNEV